MIKFFLIGWVCGVLYRGTVISLNKWWKKNRRIFKNFCDEYRENNRKDVAR